MSRTLLSALALILSGCTVDASIGSIPAEGVVYTAAVAPQQPRNFSWIEDGIAGMAYPRPGVGAKAEATFLTESGVTLFVSLTSHQPDPSTYHDAGLSTLHLPVTDFTAPTLEQLDAFVQAVETTLAADGAVTVHCGAGMGRTGTMLAGWLVAGGMTAPAAIARIRELRPGSIETASQEAILAEFETHRARVL